MSDLIPAAEYLRMSTEHQRYSIDNQRLANKLYAEAQGFAVVKSYTDGAKSGVVLKHRDGLRQLLHDVTSPDRSFKAILVYDVSRWGRFQDSDESAHYEFLCKSAGVPVHYCAEAFVNDGTVASMLLKALKRTMAGEYSRELGIKVLAGLKRLAALGFKQGGCAGYGLRRMLVSAEGNCKMPLCKGERKSIATDRVIFVPGPAEEVACVREIYRLFVEEKRTVYGIARELNRRGTKYLENSPWDYQAVYNILSHPKYAGSHVFGRTSQRLGTASVPTPESEWVVVPNAFLPIVDIKVFREVQRLLSIRTINKSDEDLLEALRLLLVQEGRLSLRLIKESSETPSPSVYRGRFGSVRRAYELIGYGRSEDFERIDLRRRTQAKREELIREIQQTFSAELSIVRRGGRWRARLRLRSGLIVTVLMCRSIGRETIPCRWQVSPLAHERRWITLIVLLESNNCSVYDMYLFLDMRRCRHFHVTADHLWLKSGVHLKSITQFLEAVLRLRKKRRNQTQ